MVCQEHTALLTHSPTDRHAWFARPGPSWPAHRSNPPFPGPLIDWQTGGAWGPRGSIKSQERQRRYQHQSAVRRPHSHANRARRPRALRQNVKIGRLRPPVMMSSRPKDARPECPTSTRDRRGRHEAVPITAHYRPITIAVTRAAERERSDAMARALFVAEPENYLSTNPNPHYLTHTHSNT
mgnify:CR=1 FL=1